MAESADFSHFGSHRYANLTTFRKSGVGIATPMWFVLDGDKLYMYTSGTSGKVKRLRQNPKVSLAPSDARGRPKGAAVSARATFLDDTEAGRIDALLRARYGWQHTLVRTLGRLRPGPAEPHAYLQFTADPT